MKQNSCKIILKVALLLVLPLVVLNANNKDVNWTEESPKRMNWYKANEFCKNDNARLPSYEELRNLWIDSNMSSDIKGFDLSVSYWTSTEVKGNPRAAVPFYFGAGKEGWYYKDDNYGVRCIKN